MVMKVIDKKCSSYLSILTFLYCIPTFAYADVNADHKTYQIEILKTREEVSAKEADYVYKN